MRHLIVGRATEPFVVPVVRCVFIVPRQLVANHESYAFVEFAQMLTKAVEVHATQGDGSHGQGVPAAPHQREHRNEFSAGGDAKAAQAVSREVEERAELLVLFNRVWGHERCQRGAQSIALSDELQSSDDKELHEILHGPQPRCM